MVFNKHTIGKLQLSPNFGLHEFYSPDDDSEYVVVDYKLVYNLQMLRDELGDAIQVNSGYRSPKYNKSVGGTEHSQHLFGRAADIRWKGDMKVLADACSQLPDAGGIGLYIRENRIVWVHFDVRKIDKIVKWVKQV